MEILNLIVQFFSKPAILVGLITMVGLVVLKKPFGLIVSGTIKTILGFLILNAGAGVVVGAIAPLNSLLFAGFNLKGALPVNEVFVALAQQKLGQQIALVFALAFVINILLARFTPLKYIFLTGHHTLFMSTLTVGLLGLSVIPNNTPLLIIVSALITGVSMVVFPALSAPYMEKIIGSKDFVMGHFGTVAYVTAGFLGKFFGKPEDSSEKLKFPEWISFLKEPLVAMGIIAWVLFIIASIAAVSTVGVAEVQKFYGSTDSWILSSFLSALTFAAGIGVILLGVRMILADIVPAFRGFAKVIVPNAIPALDCPVVFPYAPNAVLLGMLGSIVGQVLTMVIAIAAGGAIGAIILPSTIAAFFLGGTAGVFGNATGGWKGALIGGFLNGIIFTLLAGTAYIALGKLGFSNSTFGDADFGVIGNILSFVGSIFK